ARGRRPPTRRRPALCRDRGDDGQHRGSSARQRLPGYEATQGADEMNTNDLKKLTSATDAASRSSAAAARLPSLAADGHLLDVAIAVVGSPVGDLLVAVTPRGLSRVAFQDEVRDDV